MSKIKLLFQQALMISTGILFVIAVGGIVHHLQGNDIAYSWYTPISVIISGFLCAIPTLLLCVDDTEGRESKASPSDGYEEKGLEASVVRTSRKNANAKKNRYYLRIILHCILLYGIVSLLGYVFRWYEGLMEYVLVMLSYFLVYLFVWVATLWIWKKEDEKINDALQGIQDEE